MSGSDIRDIDSLKTELTRTAAQFSASQEHVRKLEHEKAYMQKILDARESDFARLSKETRFTVPDQQRLRTIIHAAAEIIHGGPVESVRLIPK